MSAWYEDTDNNGPVRAHLLYEPGVFCTVNLTCAKSSDVEFSSVRSGFTWGKRPRTGSELMGNLWNNALWT